MMQDFEEYAEIVLSLFPDEHAVKLIEVLSRREVAWADHMAREVIKTRVKLLPLGDRYKRNVFPKTFSFY
jgi:hypothetical protein